MEDTNFNPISGEQVPYRDLTPDNQGENISDLKTQSQIQSNKQSVGKPANTKEFIIEKKVKSLKYWIIILGGILIMLLIALISVLAIIYQKPVTENVKQTPPPTVIATPVENENIPKDVVDRVKQMRGKVDSLDIEENELSFPNIDWQIKY